jgi:hypothetical protein
VKLAFDENVPLGMVRAFQSLARERKLLREMGNFDVVCAQEYTPDPSGPDYIRKCDVPWLTRFAEDGGRVVVSGDCSMLEKPHELLALKQAGFIVVFFENRWSNWDFFKKSSLLLYYWATLARRVKTSRKGTMWRVPGHWRENETLGRITIKQDKLQKRAPVIRVTKVKPRRKAEGRMVRQKPPQGELDLSVPPSGKKDGGR